MKRIIALAAFTVSAVLAGSVVAQEAPDHMLMVQAPADASSLGTLAIFAQNGVSGTGNVLVQKRGTAMSGPVTVTVSGTEFLMGGKPVKGAPFSADAVTETVQTLADGNRITNSSTTKLYRDSEGRTRQELGSDAQTMTVLPFPGPTLSHAEVLISDPVAGVSYRLNSMGRTAVKLSLPRSARTIVRERDHAEAGNAASLKHLPEADATRMSEFFTLQSGNNMVFHTNTSGQIKTESLGKQTIEGVEAQGQRVTQTIPAGRIGNQMPIVSTTETWFSPGLQRLIVSKRHDPRFGDTTFKLTNITLTEPAAALFQVPSDYTVIDPRAEAERARKQAEVMRKQGEAMRKQGEQMRKHGEEMRKQGEQMREQMRKEFQRMKPEMDKMREDLERQKPELERLRADAVRIHHEAMESLSDLAR